MNYGIRRFAGGFGRPLFVSGRPPCMAALQDGRDGVVSVGAHSVRPQRLVFRLLCRARRLEGFPISPPKMGLSSHVPGPGRRVSFPAMGKKPKDRRGTA